MRNLLIIVGIIVLVIVVLFFLIRGLQNGNFLPLLPRTSTESSEGDGARVGFGDCDISVDLARTDNEKQQGLAGRDSLGESDGMLFLFDEAGKYPFWMRDMNFDIDIIYINGEEIVEIFENAKKPTSPTSPDIPIYRPAHDANRVLEVKAGRSNECGAQVGDAVEFSGL